MAFKLLTNLNESVKAELEHQALLEDFTSELFGDMAAASYDDYAAAWDRAKDAVRDPEAIEEAQAALDRAGERDWVQQTSDAAREKKRATNRTLGIKEEGDPEKGDIVVLGAAGLGQIVDVDGPSEQVIIRNKAGEEKVVKMSMLLGPKTVNGKKSWALTR